MEQGNSNAPAPAEPGRLRLLSDRNFKEVWTSLLELPSWQSKSPRAILWHLDRLAAFPTDFATDLVCRAGTFGLPFVVPKNAQALFRKWKANQEKTQNETRQAQNKGL